MTDVQRQYTETLNAIGAGVATDAGSRQFISFRIGGEDYAVDILAVREIKGWTRTTALPGQPEYVRGVLNLRGAIVPVFDVRARFGQGLTEATAKHVVIIVAVQERLLGLLVDQVSDILSANSDEIGPVPDSSAAANRAYLAGILLHGEAMVVLLDLANLFPALEIAEASTVCDNAA